MPKDDEIRGEETPLEAATRKFHAAEVRAANAMRRLLLALDEVGRELEKFADDGGSGEIHSDEKE